MAKGKPRQIARGAVGRVGGLSAHAIIKGKAKLSGQVIPGNPGGAQNAKNWVNRHPIAGKSTRAKGKPGY